MKFEPLSSRVALVDSLLDFSLYIIESSAKMIGSLEKQKMLLMSGSMRFRSVVSTYLNTFLGSLDAKKLPFLSKANSKSEFGEMVSQKLRKIEDASPTYLL